MGILGKKPPNNNISTQYMAKAAKEEKEAKEEKATDHPRAGEEVRQEEKEIGRHWCATDARVEVILSECARRPKARRRR